ncbi:MAG: Fic family protein [Thermodesulfobacteriota bacterium]
MMSEMVTWLNSDLEIHPVLISGIAQFQLVHIHPFLDGNGRVSRLFSTLCLYRAGYDSKRLFTISEYYDRDRPTFYKKIQSVRENGMDMTGWLDYFITGLEVTLRTLQRDLKTMIEKELIASEGATNQLVYRLKA